MKKIVNWITVISFLFIIGMPLLFINTNPNKISIIENRKLSQRPIIFDENRAFNFQFITEFENYVNDNIGFKQEAVLLNVAASYKFFNKVTVPDYFSGTEGHLFFGTESLNVATWQGTNHYDASQMQNFVETFTKLDALFSERGSDFFVMTIPDKENVYPELYPKSIHRFSEATKLDVLTDTLSATTEVNVLNVKSTLVTNKKDELLYYKSYDPAHWNMNGAFVGYTSLMKQISAEYPEITILSKDDFEITQSKTSGTLAFLSGHSLVADTMQLDDVYYDYNLKSGFNARQLLETPNGISLDPNSGFQRYQNQNNPSAPTLLIMGDSYIASFLLPILSESFSDLYFISPRNALEIVDLYNAVLPDIVLYETVERSFLGGTIQVLQMLPHVATAKYTYAQLPITKEDPIFRIDTGENGNGVLTVNTKTELQQFTGWALDTNAMSILSNIYAKLGDDYYKAMPIARPDVAGSNTQLLMSGYQFSIPTEALVRSDSISFVLVSGNESCQYSPIEYSLICS